MAAHGARRLQRMTENLFHIVGIEAICGAQGVEPRSRSSHRSLSPPPSRRFRADRSRRSSTIATWRQISPPRADLVHSGALPHRPRSAAGGLSMIPFSSSARR
jgi:histidine ammonia-lyase